MYIDGVWHAAQSGSSFASYNPFTAEPWATIPEASADDVDHAVTAAQRAFPGWSKTSATQRGAMLVQLGLELARHGGELLAVEVRDNGKIISEAAAQLREIPHWYSYYGGLADKIQGSVIPTEKPDMLNYTKHEPIGVVAAITAWNSPLLQLSFKLAPALAAGNCVVVKPSEFASASTLEFMKIVESCGFPPGVINVVTGGRSVGSALVGHPGVGQISFTGSDRTGRHIYETAARGLKRVSLELGGKSPNIVFADARLDAALPGAVSGIFAAAGQSCTAGSRLLVHRSIHDEFVERLVAFASSARLGNPSSYETQIGPIATEQQLRKIGGYIELGRAEGAECRLGGGYPASAERGNGWFVEPTIFSGVTNGMRIAREEIFGPVLSVIPFADDEEAVAIANDTEFGLAAGVWTQDIGRAISMIERLQAGTVWVNTYRSISYMAPFGGYKSSGVGRENGRDSIYEYLQTKSAFISTGGSVANPFIIR